MFCNDSKSICDFACKFSIKLSEFVDFDFVSSVNCCEDDKANKGPDNNAKAKITKSVLTFHIVTQPFSEASLEVEPE